MNPYVSSLSLYDIAGTPGVAADISHINTKAIAKVSGSLLPVRLDTNRLPAVRTVHQWLACFVATFGKGGGFSGFQSERHNNLAEQTSHLRLPLLTRELSIARHPWPPTPNSFSFE